LHPQGIIGGGQIGYNWQTSNIVFGIEADIDGRNATASANGLMPFAPADTFDQVNISQTDNWLSTVRGRLGVTFGNVLLYGTGGAAFGEVDHSYTQIRTTTGQALTLSDSDTRSGWAAGVGIEAMVWNNVSLGVEYLHVDLGTSTLVQGTAITSGGLVFPPSSTSFQNRQDMVRAKLNWHFNFGGPLATRY
jgi:outer membrane immunogenic protein